MKKSATSIRYHETPDRARYETMTPAEIRAAFLLEDLFSPDKINLVHWDQDRAIVGGAIPASGPLKLDCPELMRSEYFCERREIGVINIGGRGSVGVDGKNYKVGPRDGLYIGRGSREIVFNSNADNKPAKFYLLSYLAHHEYPTTTATKAKANCLELGSMATCNERTLYQMIHLNGVKSCQLVMGFTELKTGSAWNSFPPHTHQRRTEVYLYFDFEPEALAVHLMGPPQSTRHVFVREAQAVLSPPWSIHCGAGSSRYRFIWGMGGDNQRFDDMDHVKITELK